MTDQPPTEKPPHNAYRSFHDSKGQQWLVWKVAEAAVNDIRSRGGTADSPSLGKAWLVFLSLGGETRRIAPVPDTWRTLSVEELERLLQEAKPFQRRT
jgi:hypothetical protein